MVRVARLRLSFLWLVGAGLFLAAGRGVWSSLVATLDNYLSQHVSYGFQEDMPAGLSITTKHEVSAVPLKSMGKSSGERGPQQGGKGDKIVLFWTSWFGKSWWVRLGGGMDLGAAQCPETRCVFTHDRSTQHEAAAVLFQSQGVDVQDFPRGREWWQRWVWVHVEAPPASAAAYRKLHDRSLIEMKRSTERRSQDDRLDLAALCLAGLGCAGSCSPLPPHAALLGCSEAFMLFP